MQCHGTLGEESIQQWKIIKRHLQFNEGKENGTADVTAIGNLLTTG